LMLFGARIKSFLSHSITSSTSIRNFSPSFISSELEHAAMSGKRNPSANERLIKSLKGQGVIKSNIVEDAMNATDRGLYSKHAEVAYNDHPHEIGYGVTISAPHMHAYCLELLKDYITRPASRSLDVGSGSGYLSACMARMSDKDSKVFGIDVIEPLVGWSIENIKRDDPELLKSGKLNIKVGDGWKGDKEHGPFDAIHVGAAAETLPVSLVEQLKPEGRLVIPVGPQGGSQYLLQVDKHKDGTVTQHRILGVNYVPLVKQNQ